MLYLLNYSQKDAYHKLSVLSHTTSSPTYPTYYTAQVPGGSGSAGLAVTAIPIFIIFCLAFCHSSSHFIGVCNSPLPRLDHKDQVLLFIMLKITTEYMIYDIIKEKRKIFLPDMKSLEIEEDSRMSSLLRYHEFLSWRERKEIKDNDKRPPAMSKISPCNINITNQSKISSIAPLIFPRIHHKFFNFW